MKNRMDSRNRDASSIVTDLTTERRRLVVVGSRRIDARATADALNRQWESIVGLVGFRPLRVITGCASTGAEKAARLVARDVTGKLAAVFHRPELVHSASMAEMFMNILLSKTGDACLVLAPSNRPTCHGVRSAFAEWSKRTFQVAVLD